MALDKLRELLQTKKNFVFIGEAGSGKTELALSLAIHMTKLTDKSVHLFDMDQTKPNFRARDAARKLENSGVKLHYHEQVLDSPVVATGVKEHLRSENAYVLLDVGGGNHGSHMIGQFHELLNLDNALVFYVLNPYRPWSGEAEDIRETMARVLGSARLRRIALLGNPNYGPGTTEEDVLRGVEKIRALTEGVPLEFVTALEDLCPGLEAHIPEPVIPIRLHTLPAWMME